MIFVANRTCGAILGARQFAYLPRICVQRSRACSKISISDPRRHGQGRWHKCAPMSVRFGGSIGRKSPNASTKTAASKLTRPNSITAIRDAGGNIWLPCPHSGTSVAGHRQWDRTSKDGTQQSAPIVPGSVSTRAQDTAMSYVKVGVLYCAQKSAAINASETFDDRVQRIPGVGCGDALVPLDQCARCHPAAGLFHQP